MEIRVFTSSLETMRSMTVSRDRLILRGGLAAVWFIGQFELWSIRGMVAS
jgi:hypothetical protein